MNYFEQEPDMSHGKMNDAATMEPWLFCSKYEGEMSETKHFWMVDVEENRFLWSKETGMFQGVMGKDEFDEDIFEEIQKQRKRIEVGIKSGELVPDVDRLLGMTAEEFAEENEVEVEYNDGKKLVCVDNMLYVWNDDKFEGFQIAVSTNLGKNKLEDNYAPEGDDGTTMSDMEYIEASFIKEVMYKIFGLEVDLKRALMIKDGYIEKIKKGHTKNKFNMEDFE